jgi:hypothetical protein
VETILRTDEDGGVKIIDFRFCQTFRDGKYEDLN